MEQFFQVCIVKVGGLDFPRESLCCAVHAEVLAEACEIIDGLALPKHSKCSVVGKLFMDNVGEDMVELIVFLSRGDVP